MISILITIILFTQAVTVYLDNKCNMYDFFVKCAKGDIATAYTNRGILLTISRTLFFIVPPLLGYLITKLDIDECFNLLIYAALINLILTSLQGFMYHKLLNLKLLNFKIIYKIFKSISGWIGILAFTFFLITPYLLNYLALIFTQDSLWIVQLNNILNSLLTLYVIFIFEPKVAASIDKNINIDLYFSEAFMVRFFGRLFALILIICYSFIQVYYN
jgi:hypothetical protein